MLGAGQAQVKQADTVLKNISSVSNKFVQQIDKKIDKYSNRISSKTERTLTKLAKWENKIKTSLEKISPNTANQLFGNNQITFSSILKQIKNGEAVKLDYQQQYNQYKDELTTKIKYLETQKQNINENVIKKITTTKQKIMQINAEADSVDAIQKFIVTRKKEIIKTALLHLGRSKYLIKMNKEVWYYAETMKNYKEIFTDEAKTEKLIKELLNKIPGFQQFIQKNSMLATLFGSPNIDDVANTASLSGLQTRASTQSIIQDRIAGGGPNAQQLITQNIQAAQAELNQIKDKLLKATNGTGSGEGNLPDFKPNMQKTKTVAQRLEYGSNIQFAKSSTLLPTTMDIALTVGYKLNDKSVAGFGASYKLGLGSIDHIELTNQGISIRSFLDWKLKKQFFVSGGWELNYLTTLPTQNILLPKVNNSSWQQAALAGISKKIKVKTKLFKETKMQLLFDFLAKQHLPASQPILFRMGYSF